MVLRALGKCKGVVVLIHGLNQSPAGWRDMIPALNSWGFHVYLLCLKGHRGVTEDGIFHVDADGRLRNFMDGYKDVRERFPFLPRILVAYSLGALVAMVAQGKRAGVLFERQVLLAPAIITKVYTRLVLLLTKFMPQVPSGSPEYYRANKNGVSAAGYRALFDLEDTLKNEQQYELPKCPTCIVMRRDDELISYKGVKRLIESKRLDTYTLLTVPESIRGDRVVPHKHLIIDRRCLGEHEWLWLLREMKMFLGADG